MMRETTGQRSRRKRLAALLVVVGLLCGVLGAVWAMDWPVESPKLAATFGTSAKGRIVTGIAIAASNGLVRSIDDGELAFAFDGGTTPSGLPSTLGSFVVVEHPNGLAAVYAHLLPGSVSGYLTTVKRDTILGSIGSSGWTEGQGLLLEVFDRRKGNWVNPLLLLPAIDDGKAPTIRSVALMSKDKSYVLGETKSILQGTYQVAADVFDATDAPWTAGPLAPYVIRLSIDGTELSREVFDVAVGKDGRLSLFSASPRPLSELRTTDGRYLLAEHLFTRGRSIIELSAEDAVGNRRDLSWSVSVQ
jgi:hypothetical protein